MYSSCSMFSMLFHPVAPPLRGDPALCATLPEPSAQAVCSGKSVDSEGRCRAIRSGWGGEEFNETSRKQKGIRTGSSWLLLCVLHDERIDIFVLVETQSQTDPECLHHTCECMRPSHAFPGDWKEALHAFSSRLKRLTELQNPHVGLLSYLRFGFRWFGWVVLKGLYPLNLTIWARSPRNQKYMGKYVLIAFGTVWTSLDQPP